MGNEVNKVILMILGVAMVIMPQAILAAGDVVKGDAAAGKVKTAVCAACHGPDGNSVNPDWPKLAGQGVGYMVKQLKDLKEKTTRDDPIMGPMAIPLNEQDMLDIAAYYASQTQQPGVANAEVVVLGENIYRGGNTESSIAACTGCHAPDGTGNPAAKFPRVAGQHAKYIAKQLRNFRSGVRSNDSGKMMRNITKRMTDAEIEAVSQYIAGLR